MLKTLLARKNIEMKEVMHGSINACRLFKDSVQQGRSERLKMILPSLLVYVAQDGPDESPTARVLSIPPVPFQG